MSKLTAFSDIKQLDSDKLKIQAIIYKRELDGPPLTPGARAYLNNRNGDQDRLEVEAQLVASEYGSLRTHRLHCVIASKRLAVEKDVIAADSICSTV